VPPQWREPVDPDHPYCSATHSIDVVKCYPLKVEIYRPRDEALAGWKPAEASRYSHTHGTAALS